MHRTTRALALPSILFVAVLVSTASAITIDIDYTYDTSNFFSYGNPQGAAAGQQARAALEAAADFFSNIFDDSFSAIDVPAPFQSASYDTSVTWYFDAKFNDPSTGAPLVLNDPQIGADQYLVFAGARDHVGTTAAIGGPGGYARGSSVSGSGKVTPAEANQLDQTTSEFFDAVDHRGQVSGYSRWGGAISFDTSARNWHFDHTTPPTSGATDLYSVAIHELAHALGFGASSEWMNFVSGSAFVGPAAGLEYGGLVPLAPGENHWAEGVASTVFGTSTPQEAVMDPTILGNIRKRFTDLDAAAMADLGWSVVPLPALEGDYNQNGIVDAADFTIWRNTLGQNVSAGSGADGNRNAVIDLGDYTLWKNNFATAAGASVMAQAVMAHSVPEPGAFALLFFGALFFAHWRRRVLARRLSIAKRTLSCANRAQTRRQAANEYASCLGENM